MSSASPSAPAARPASKLDELLGIDLRSLACFRMGLAFLLLWDLYGRAKTLRMHYTGEGVYPREIALAIPPDSRLFHVFLWSDRVDVQTGLFVVFALLAVALLLGWHTRVVSVLSFVFLASLVKRNHYVCHTGDVWLKALSFWAMFLPLGAHFSLDRLRSPWRAPRATRVLSLASAGVTLQIAIFYVLAGYLKSRYDVWQRGDAVWVFTHVIEYTRPFGAWLGQYPGACRLFTFATLVVEGLAPFLLFCPLGTRWLRGGFCLVLAASHLTLQTTIHIGVFQLLCIVALTLLWPSAAWDGLARRVPAGLVVRWSTLRDGWNARYGRAQVSDAPPPGALLGAGRTACAAFLVLVLGVVFVSNANSAVKDPYDREDAGVIKLPQVLDDYGRMASMVQSWNMFTDIDRLFFGWFLVLGQQEDGTLVDVLEQAPFREIRVPEHYASFFPNHNSRRYWRELTLTDGGKPREFLQKPMCDYLAREWSQGGRPALTHLALFHVGRVPSREPENDLVKRVCAWEAPHEPLKSAAPEVQQLWTQRRASWNAFLEGLPKRVPAAQ